MFPVILVLAIAGFEALFVWLFCINLVTDILDGLIARVFKLTTEFGARIDSIADFGTYILAFYGLFAFKYEDFQGHFFSLGVFAALFLFCYLIPLFRWKRLPSFHLYSWKIGGYIQGIFFFVLFAVGFQLWFYYLMVSWGICSFLEHLIIQTIITEPKSNLKGLYWVLRNKSL
jgi:CDP-diacylglycerol--glycerol-3-phosphate 3-phosphatidyltransferase